MELNATLVLRIAVPIKMVQTVRCAEMKGRGSRRVLVYKGDRMEQHRAAGNGAPAKSVSSNCIFTRA